MIDIHSHIIANIDDGAKDFDTSIQMIKIAEKNGTSKIIATPHYCVGYGETPYNEVKEIVSKLRESIKELNLNIELYHGQEVYLSTSTIEDYEDGIIGTINDGNYMLFELPMRSFDEETFDIIHEMKIKGVRLIMAHPERYKPIMDKPEVINDFIEEGILFQLNLGSIEGKFGKTVKKTAEILLQNNIYNFTGSDAHDLKIRNTNLTKGLEELSKISEKAYTHFLESSERMLNSEEVRFIGNKIKGKKSLFSLFKKN